MRNLVYLDEISQNFICANFSHFSWKPEFFIFRENHKILSVFAKIFATRINFCKNSNFSRTASRVAPVLHIFREDFREKNIFAKISRHENIFTKMVPLFHILLTSFAFFSKKPKKKSTFVNFSQKISARLSRKMFINFANFCKQMFAKIIFTKMRKRKSPFQSYFRVNKARGK